MANLFFPVNSRYFVKIGSEVHLKCLELERIRLGVRLRIRYSIVLAFTAAGGLEQKFKKEVSLF
jgi:hypothetical protein